MKNQIEETDFFTDAESAKEASKLLGLAFYFKSRELVEVYRIGQYKGLKHIPKDNSHYRHIWNQSEIEKAKKAKIWAKRKRQQERRKETANLN